MSDLQAFRVFSQHPKWVYHAGKLIEKVFYCFYEITMISICMTELCCNFAPIKSFILITNIGWREKTNESGCKNELDSPPLTKH